MCPLNLDQYLLINFNGVGRNDKGTSFFLRRISYPPPLLTSSSLSDHKPLQKKLYTCNNMWIQILDFLFSHWLFIFAFGDSKLGYLSPKKHLLFSSRTKFMHWKLKFAQNSQGNPHCIYTINIYTSILTTIIVPENIPGEHYYHNTTFNTILPWLRKNWNLWKLKNH